MTGKVRSLLDKIVQKRAGGDPVLEISTKTKLILKGLDPDRYTNTTPDDPATIAKVMTVAREMGINL